MEASGTNMITATREYQRGSAHLQVQVITGAALSLAKKFDWKAIQAAVQAK